MKKINWDRESIAYRLTVFMVIIILGQSLLLIGTLVAGGVLKHAEETAFKSFYEKVNNRKDYLQREMKNRWTNMKPYTEEIADILSIFSSHPIALKESREAFFDKSAPTLIAMLRTTMATGVFVILNDEFSGADAHSALYFRDYDPLLNDKSNKDLYLVIGSPEISKKWQIPMEGSWKYSLFLSEENEDFYYKPYNNAGLSSDADFLGYWSKPFQLAPNDLKIITYTMPLFDKQGQLYGVIGIEITESYLNSFLPATDLAPQDSLGYLIGIQNEGEDQIQPLIMNGALQKRMIRKDEAFSFISEDEATNIYLLNNHNSKDNVYVCVEKMGLYYNHTPFVGEQWYLIGMMEQKTLLAFIENLKKILLASFVGCMIIGGVGGYFVIYQFTKPIVNLAKRVRQSDIGGTIEFGKIGLTEIDDLSNAIQVSNKNLLESTLKMSQIISLVDVAIGAFEYKEKSKQVFATDRLKDILLLANEESIRLYQNKRLFVEKLQKILDRPEPEEEDIYKIADGPPKWVKIKMLMNKGSTIGVAIDVTEEIEEKNKIKLDRDYDPLTKLYNRRAFEQQIQLRLEDNNLRVAAFIMLDLDYLKHINDNYGHKWGDIYIKTTAELLSQFSKDRCIVGRRSGDEFYVFLYGFENKGEIRNLVQQFYKALKTHTITFPEGIQREIMISAGLAWCTGNKQEYDELIHCADLALYEAKNDHKGQLCEFKGES